MDRYDLFKYKNDKIYLTNKFNEIEAEREKLYKTTPTYEENYGGSYRDKIGDGIIKLIEKQEYYDKEIKEMAKRLREVERAVRGMRTSLYRNILDLLFISSEHHTIHEIWEEDLLGRHYTDEKYVSLIKKKALDEFDELYGN